MGEIFMIKYYGVEEQELDLRLDYLISRHSADITLPYKTVFGLPVYLGYYLPDDFIHKDKYPLFVFVHGGGWSSHMIFEGQPHWQGDYLGYLARYYADKGFVCVSIDYRLVRDSGQEAGYELIDCYEDCCDAMDYVINHATEYGIDTRETYLLGESAGGYLTGALAAFHYDRQYFFRKIFLVNAITHFSDKWQAFVPISSSHPRLAGLSFGDCVEFLSPLCQIREDFCETVLIHGESDTVVEPIHSRKFYDRMAELSIKCELHLIEKTEHAFLLAEYNPVKQGAACRIGIKIIDDVLFCKR